MELETRQFYDRARRKVSDASTRRLLGDLAEVERRHYRQAESLEKKLLTTEARAEEEAQGRKLFLLQIVQPGLAGLMDGSVRRSRPYLRRSTCQPGLKGSFSPCGIHF
jgi:rubrerythrin